MDSTGSTSRTHARSLPLLALALVIAGLFLTPVSPAAAQTVDTAKKVAKPKAKVAPARSPVAPTASSSPAAEGTAKPDDADALRKAAQNPIANMISVPFQNNTNFDVGPYHRPQNVLNFQPVIPIHVTDDWNLITRWITPIIYQPRVSPTEGAEFGLGNCRRPSSCPRALGRDHLGRRCPDLAADGDGQDARHQQVGSRARRRGADDPGAVGRRRARQQCLGRHGEPRVNLLTVQPFVNYNLPHGWYLTSSPIITSNWVAKGDDRWTVPVGGGVGRLFKIDKLPVNTQLQAFYNVVRPTNAASWTLRFQLQFLFPS